MAAQSKRHHDRDREGRTGMRVSASDKRDVGREHIDPGKRVRKPAAGMPVVVPQKAVVLIQQFRRTDLAWEYRPRRGWRSKSQSSMGALPEHLSEHLQPSLDDVVRFQAG